MSRHLNRVRLALFFRALFVCLCVAGMIAQPAVGKGLHWYKQFYPTLAAAREQKKRVLVVLYIDDGSDVSKSLHADTMEETPQNKQMLDFINKHFVCMKANPDKGDGIGIKEKYRATVYPCSLVLDRSGRQLGFLPGPVPSSQTHLELMRIVQRN